MSTHAEIAPSSMGRIINCPASVKASLNVDPRDDDEWNIEGTIAHEKLELWLSLGVPPTDGILYEHLEHAFEYALELERDGFVVEFERQVRYNERIWGTADIIGIRRRAVRIGDYKHGYRLVEHINCAQTATYGVCAQVEFDTKFSDVELTIIQPRIPHRDGPVRRWVTDGAMLEWHEQEMLSAVRRVDSDNPEFHAGKHCKFCPLEGNCKTYVNWIAINATGEEFF